jgi:rhodanese-related sulfurtransferase
MLKRLLCAIYLLVACTAACAMSFELKQNQLFVSGRVDDDIRQFQEHLTNKAIDTIVFVNSPGGSLHTALRVAEMIANRGVNTVVAGSCQSACSVMFLGGRERRFSDAFPAAATFIGIHGAHNAETKQIDQTLQPRLYAFYKYALADKFDSELMHLALYKMDDATAMLRVMEATRNPASKVHFCKSAFVQRKDCAEFPQATALTLGILTHPELIKLELPESLKSVVALFGVPLANPAPDHAICASAACAQRMESWRKAPDSKAIASRQNSPGIGVSMRLDSPLRASYRALYNCNHLPNLPPALCEVVAVNGLEASTVYTNAKLEHEQARALLKLPNEQYYANEQYGTGFGSHKGLRVLGKPSLTPGSIAGITSIATKDLVAQLISEAPPYIIDVLALGNETLPSAQAIAFGGVHLEDAAKEQELTARFLSLLALLAPDKTRPIVFFCLDRESWRSVNAAQRALEAGYTRVLWYRGGLQSWKAAGLPTAPLALRAVAN